MRNTRKILVALLVLMTLMVSVFSVTANAAAGQTWTVAGSKTLCGSDWSTTDTKNDMTYDAATDSYVKVYQNVKAGTYQFKCAKNHAWTTAYPSSNYNLTVKKDGSTVTITLKGTKVTATVEEPTCNHTYVLSAETVTCTAAGTRTWTCSICSDSYTENLSALGHRYGEDGKCNKCDVTTSVVKVYVDNTANWAEVSCYAWDSNNTPYVAWPGEAMEQGDDGRYFYVIPTSFANVIFNNNGSGLQSADLKTPTTDAVIYDNAAKTWYAPHVHNYTVPATCTKGVSCECGAVQPDSVPAAHGSDTCTCTLVKLDNAKNWSKVYCYYADADWAHTLSDPWPGTQISAGEDGLFYCYLPAGTENLIFNGGSDANKTADLKVPTDGKYIFNNSTNAWTAPHTHSWSDATCTEPQKCECGEIQGEALGHTYKAVVTAPTCTAEGYTTHTCEACGDSYTNEATPMVGHNPGEKEYALNDGSIPACQFDNPWIQSCTACGEIVNSGADGAIGHYVVLDICLLCYYPQPSLTLGDNTVVVPESGSAFGMIYIAEAGVYQVATNPATTACIFYTNVYGTGADFSIAEDGTLGASWYVFSLAPVELQPGYYYVGVYGFGEYSVNLSLHTEHTFVEGKCACGEVDPDYVPENPGDEDPHVNTLVVGETNDIYVDGSVLNDWQLPIAWVEFVVTEKANYKFECAETGALALIYATDKATNLCGYSGAADLEPGTYYVCVGGGVVGMFHVTVTMTEISDEPGTEEPPVEYDLPELVVGENTVSIDGSVTNFIGNAIAWYKFVVTEAGTYATVSDTVNGYFYTEPSLTSTNLCGLKGVVDLEPGTYYICVGKEGKTGEFTITIDNSGNVEAPASNTVALGENKYVLNAPLLAIGYEFTIFTAEKAGWYTITGADPITFFIWPDYPNVAVTDIPTTAPYAWNVKHDNSGFEDSITVYLEAGVYAVGFRFDFAAVGEYEYTISYSETDPNPAPEQPDVTPDETPDETPEQPVAELTFFEKIMKAISDFFAQITAWFENLFAGNKK